MNFPDPLTELYSEWRSVSHAEGEAIQTRDWPAVERFQLRKEELKRNILPATEAWGSRWSREEERRREYDRVYRPIVAELITLEHRNHELLCARREQAHREIAENENALGNLRGIQRAYSRNPVGSWESYS
jgi:hypothetical protein